MSNNHRRAMLPADPKPPCGCVSTNVNNLAPEKGYNSLGIERPEHDLPVRPPSKNTTSLGIAAPALFAHSIPKVNLTWRSSSNASNPGAQKTAAKAPDRRGRF